jgi:very-short-patch-repair endonuclease
VARGFARDEGGCIQYLLYLIMEHSNSNYNPNLQPFANKLRKDMTKAEASLWKYVLSARQMKGYQFRRERPVLNYIADFMCKELQLVIEVDGLTHQWEEVFAKDNRKDEDLRKAGFVVLRFNDADVLNNMHQVIRIIEAKIEDIEQERLPDKK